MEDLEIFSKVCLPCVMGDDWTRIQAKLIQKGYRLKVRRTTYDPRLHEIASGLWGGDNYLAFASFRDGKVVALGALESMIDDLKDKRVKAGKSKPVRKKRSKKNELCGLSKTARPIRVDSVESEAVEIKVETKTRQKIQGDK